MQDYDTVLKLLLRKSAGCMLQQVTHASIHSWLDVELTRVEQTRVDLLGRTEAGDLEHIELQSNNHPQMPLRMLEYRMGIYRHFERFPHQTVLYVGKDKLTMANGLETEQMSFHYSLVNASDLDGEELLASDNLSDNVLAILAHVRSQGDAIRKIVERIGRLGDPVERQHTASQFLILSGLRALGEIVREEWKRMPITESILNHDVIGPAYRSGMQKGLEEGRLEGQIQGRLEGEREILRRLLEKRFGPLPVSAATRLDQSTKEALEEIGIRLLDARSLQELLP